MLLNLPGPSATCLSPTAMFADVSSGRSPDSRLHPKCRRMAFPRPISDAVASDPPLFVYRCGGSAGMGFSKI
jgi:hypothetical protein